MSYTARDDLDYAIVAFGSYMNGYLKLKSGLMGGRTLVNRQAVGKAN
jgi:hypothetical protein